MNRNIQFRAKRSDNGEWVYGFYAKGLIDVRDDQEVYRHFIMVWDVNGYFTDYIVDAKTVGQLTGLLDKNGKDIYEGDIIRWHDIVTADYPITFTNGVFCLNNRTDENFHHHRYEIGDKWEVIGSIYEETT